MARESAPANEKKFKAVQDADYILIDQVTDQNGARGLGEQSREKDNETVLKPITPRLNG